MATNCCEKIKDYLNPIVLPLYAWYYRTFNGSNTFYFQKNEYKYFYHHANATWTNERAVEIPIICKYIKTHQNSRILEIGNVLSHYFQIYHEVVDKYEKAPGVINQDVVDYTPDYSYDLIISISTLEHVGWDETPRDPEKIISAIENLKKILAPGGIMIITLPIGENRVLDSYLEKKEIELTENYYLKRISQDNQWVELNSGFEKAQYGYPFHSANFIYVGIYYK
jgi:hypothetical protein